MFTKNWYELIAAQYLERNSTAYKTTCPNIVTVGGTVYSSLSGYSIYSNVPELRNILANVKNNISTSSFIDKTTAVSGYGVIFGTGNESATVDDIKLSGDIVSGFSVSKVDEDDQQPNYYEWKKVYTITNTNSTDITIGEIGLYNCIQNQTQQYGTTYYYPYLLERTALETPITIPAGGVGQVTYAIRFNYPTA